MRCWLPSRAVVPDFAGWHAFNGRSLGNPRLGYVSCHMLCQGDPYDAGYFKIYDHDLSPEECLQFSQGERIPPVDPAAQPQLSEEWTPERRLRALRNYGVEFAYEVIHTLLDLHGVGGARAVVANAVRHAAPRVFRAKQNTARRTACAAVWGLQEFGVKCAEESCILIIFI